MTAAAIRVQNLCKEYAVGPVGDRHGTLYDLLSRTLTMPYKRLRGSKSTALGSSQFSALRDVGFELHQGEVAGLIGGNGAGKSTLLKILSRITAPSQGRVTVRGRLSSLLEVGTGFHPELSGRENIFLNGAILGMKRQEVTRKFDEIVAFAEVDRFIDTPVKHYSSGMYVRLAFAVAAHLETDVLLVDEVLAVGDAAFQRKSLGKMSDVARGGRTVLFVSHNLGAVRNLCSRALLLEGGELSFDGKVEEGLARYERTFNAGMGLSGDARFDGPLAEQIKFDQLLCTQNGAIVSIIDPLHEFQIEIHGTALSSFSPLDLKISMFRDGVHLTSCYDAPTAAGMREGKFVSRFRFGPSVFTPGRYALGIGAAGITGSWLWGSEVAVLDFSDNRVDRPNDVQPGMISIPYTADRQQ